MDKVQVIEKLNRSASVVLKSKDFVNDAQVALASAIDKLTALKKEMAKTGEVPDSIYSDLGECYRIIDTIAMGYPMVPARDAAEKVEKMTAEQFVAHAASELEKAAREPREQAFKRLAAVRKGVFSWERLPQGETHLEVVIVDDPPPDTTAVDVAKAEGRIDAVAKSAGERFNAIPRHMNADRRRA